MKIARPDTTSMILAAICVVGIVALSLFHVAIPDVLAFATLTALGIGGGTALNGPSTTSPSDSTAQRIADSLSSLEQLIGGARRSSTPAPAPRASAPAQGIPAQPGPGTPAAASTPVGGAR